MLLCSRIYKGIQIPKCTMYNVHSFHTRTHRTIVHALMSNIHFSTCLLKYIRIMGVKGV